MYIIEKCGYCTQGLMWMGSDLDEAKEKADEYAAHDSDGYHSWNVSEFREAEISKARAGAMSVLVYSTSQKRTQDNHEIDEHRACRYCGQDSCDCDMI